MVAVAGRGALEAEEGAAFVEAEVQGYVGFVGGEQGGDGG